MERLSGSVGRTGINRSADVILVQKLLNHYKIPGETIPLVIDGKIGTKTIARIESFQKIILLMHLADGRVDPNGKTFNKLVSTRIGSKPAPTCTFSSKGINLLASIEELATTPYDDQTGKDINAWVKGATIGYGHLILQAEWNKYKNGITETQALTLFQTDLNPYVNRVKSSVKLNVTQNEFDAMVILTYNIGQNAFASSSVLKLVNDPTAKTSYTNLEQAWKAWDKSQGKVSKGLQNRRQSEWNIYSQNIYKKW